MTGALERYLRFCEQRAVDAFATFQKILLGPCEFRHPERPAFVDPDDRVLRTIVALMSLHGIPAGETDLPLTYRPGEYAGIDRAPAPEPAEVVSVIAARHDHFRAYMQQCSRGSLRPDQLKRFVYISREEQLYGLDRGTRIIVVNAGEYSEYVQMLKAFAYQRKYDVVEVRL